MQVWDYAVWTGSECSAFTSGSSSLRSIGLLQGSFELSGKRLDCFVLKWRHWEKTFRTQLSRSLNTLYVLRINKSKLRQQPIYQQIRFTSVSQIILNSLVGQGLFIVKASRSHTLDTPHSVGLLWTSDQSVADTSTWQHTTLTRDRHPRPWRDSNQQSQQASGRRPTP